MMMTFDESCSCFLDQVVQDHQSTLQLEELEPTSFISSQFDNHPDVKVLMYSQGNIGASRKVFSPMVLQTIQNMQPTDDDMAESKS